MPSNSDKINRISKKISSYRYTILTAVSFSLNLTLTMVFTELIGFAEEISFFLALVVVFLANFGGMRYWVYATSGPRRRLQSQFARFAASSLAIRGIEYVMFLVLHTVIGVYYSVCIISILVVSSCFKFAFYKNAVFGDQSGEHASDHYVVNFRDG